MLSPELPPELLGSFDKLIPFLKAKPRSGAGPIQIQNFCERNSRRSERAANNRSTLNWGATVLSNRNLEAVNYDLACHDRRFELRGMSWAVSLFKWSMNITRVRKRKARGAASFSAAA